MGTLNPDCFTSYPQLTTSACDTEHSEAELQSLSLEHMESRGLCQEDSLCKERTLHIKPEVLPAQGELCGSVCCWLYSCLITHVYDLGV